MRFSNLDTVTVACICYVALESKKQQNDKQIVCFLLKDRKVLIFSTKIQCTLCLWHIFNMFSSTEDKIVFYLVWFVKLQVRKQ